MFAVAPSQTAAYSSSSPASFQNPDGSYNNFEGALPTWESGGGSTPTSGSSNMIPLGNGAYFDPATGTVHYASGSNAAQ
jgi:hypothetical protein